MVSKRRSAPYRSGECRDWRKVKTDACRMANRERRRPFVFLVVALIAAAVGFGSVAGFAMEAARMLFWVFIILFVISLVAGLVRRA